MTAVNTAPEPGGNGEDSKIPTTRLELIHHLVRHCEACPLHAGRIRAVPGHGHPEARVMMVGEGPGANEDKQGRPFVGQAGKLLDKLLPLAGLSREEVYITNVIKCRAPGNRSPRAEEQEICSRFLKLQLQTIQPELVITMGQYSLDHFVRGETVTRARGRIRNIEGQLVYPIVHPAAALRRGEYRNLVEEDLNRLQDRWQEARKKPPPEESGAGPKEWTRQGALI